MSNIKIQSFDGSTYTQLFPQNSASLTTYSNTKTSISATNVQDAIDSCFTSVSNGKSLIASAITDKGVSTGSNDSFQTMANNIRNIETMFYSTNYTFTKQGYAYCPIAPTNRMSIDKIILAQLSVCDANRSQTFIYLDVGTGYWRHPSYTISGTQYNIAQYNSNGLIDSYYTWTEYPKRFAGILIYKK